MVGKIQGNWCRPSRILFHRKYKQLFFFILVGLIFLCSYSFWRRSNYFLSSWRVTVFDPGGINIFLFMQFFPAVWNLSKGSRRANYLILTQGGDKKEQYTRIRTMTDCICTLSLWSGNRNLYLWGTSSISDERVWWINTLAWTHKIGHVACVVGWCFRRSWWIGICEGTRVELSQVEFLNLS